MTGLSVIIGQLITEGRTLNLIESSLGFTTAFSLAAAAMVINDYHDREIDLINEPERPIPSGLISPNEALIYATFLESTGLLAAALSNLKCLVITIATISISILYNTKGKETGLPGNFMVSACVAMPFIYGGYLSGRGANSLLWVFGTLAFLANTGREITKGIVDVRGDKARNVRTIAATQGSRTAAFSASLFYLSAVVLSLIPLKNRVSKFYLPIVAITDIGFITSSYSLIRNPNRKNARRIKERILVYMLIGMLAFLAGGLNGEP